MIGKLIGIMLQRQVYDFEGFFHVGRFLLLASNKLTSLCVIRLCQKRDNNAQIALNNSKITQKALNYALSDVS